jgi:hypothetical protein
MSLRKFSFAAVSAILILSACSDLPSKPTQSRSRRASTLISKATWMNVLPTTMSEEFCDPDSELLQCYPMSKDECSKSVEQVTANCANSYSDRIPSHLGRTDAANWGGTIGNCTKDGILQVIESQNLTPASDACKQTVENM